MNEFQNLEKPISAIGLNCRNCGNPIDTKTTTTMLCNKCRYEYVARKAEDTCMKKYGKKNPMYVQEFVDKITDTMLKKYGTNCAMNVPEFRKKFIDTCVERYGTEYYVNSDEFINKSSCKSKTNERWRKFFEEKGIRLLEEKRIESKRFDFKIPDRKLCIEIDPTYTHSSAGSHFNPDGLPRDKQLIKTLVAERNGYRCIHVFDWDDPNDILDIISDPVEIQASDCVIKEITIDEFELFSTSGLSFNSDILSSTEKAIGIFLNNDIVQAAGFKRYNADDTWIISGLYSKRRTKVLDGLASMIHHASSELNITSFIAYCNRAKEDISDYIVAGMNVITNTCPNEIWSKGKEHLTRKEIENFIRDQEYKEGNIDRFDVVSLLEDGWLPIYDCGYTILSSGDIRSFVNENQSFDEIDYSNILKAMDKGREKLCDFCGKSFIPNSSHQRYCKRPHYMDCPVCGKRYLVTNNENLKRPPVACSYECRVKRTQKTSMEKYGTKVPGNNPEARKKAKKTMLKNHGVEYSFQSPELYQKGINTLQEKYGVNNIREVSWITRMAQKNKHDKWVNEVQSKLPIKLVEKEPLLFKIDESDMDVFILREKASTEFLKRYGHRINATFGKIHMSVGLVKEGILYQVLRFERKDKNIILADFGTRRNYFNPNYYRKLIEVAVRTVGIEEFTAIIPRNIAIPEVVDSLSLTKTKDGSEYDVFWIQPEGLEKLTSRHNIDQMKRSFDYITTDYLDEYKFENIYSNIESVKELWELPDDQAIVE